MSVVTIYAADNYLGNQVSLIAFFNIKNIRR